MSGQHQSLPIGARDFAALCPATGDGELYAQLHRSGKAFVDLSSFLGYIHRNIICIEGPCNSGKSALLSMVRCFFDDTLSMGELFENCALSKDSLNRHTMTYLNQLAAISLDFSDFNARSYLEALSHIGMKMSEQYWKFAGRMLLADCRNIDEDYLDILERTANEEKLSYSLCGLIHSCRNMKEDEGGKSRPLVLIDEATTPQIYADRYGYGQEMRRFLEKFLRIDVYEHCYGMVATCYDGYSVWSPFYGMEDSVYDFEVMRRVCELNGITPEKGGLAHWKDPMRTRRAKEAPTIPSGMERARLAFIQEQRRALRKRREEERRAQAAAEVKEREEYKKGLPSDVHIPSRNAGARTFELEASSAAYQDRNEFLRELYRKFGSKARHEDIYKRIQKVEEEIPTDWDDRAHSTLKELAETARGRWESCRVDADDHWEKVFVETPKDEGYVGAMQLIKIYASPAEGVRVSELFTEAVEMLLTEGADRFTAKVSLCKRDDAMCFWVSRADFFKLERRFDQRAEELACPLPFIAYRGKLGVSREFSSWYSHNGAQAELIRAYFESLMSGASTRRHPDGRKHTKDLPGIVTAGKGDDVDMGEMYSLFVRGWNGDLPSEHPISKSFRDENAQMLLTLLDTIDVITGKTIIDDGHLFLQQNEALWDALCWSNNWYQVGEALKEASQE